MSAPRLFTLAEVGERIGVSTTTVQRLIASGGLRAVNVAATGTGSRARLRVREDDLAKWINARTAGRRSA